MGTHLDELGQAKLDKGKYEGMSPVNVPVVVTETRQRITPRMGFSAALLGLSDYRSISKYQDDLVSARQSGSIDDRLLLMEFEPVVTIGRGGDLSQLIVDKSWLDTYRIDFCLTDRGGGATYHGPGQLVVYPILDLSNDRDLHTYIRKLELTAIRLLSDLGVTAHCRPGLTGVWIGGKKIAAIGVRVRRWVTGYGLSINLANDLWPYRAICQCGLPDAKATSVKANTGQAPDMSASAAGLIKHFTAVFGYKQTALLSVNSKVGERQS